MQDLLEIIRHLEKSGLLKKGISERIKGNAKQQSGGFLSILLSTLGASLLGDMLFDKKDKGVIRAGKGTAKVSYGSKRSSLKKILILIHPLTNFETEAYYQNESRFNSVFSRDNLPERSSTKTIKNGAYVINLDEYSDIGTHWVALHVNNKTATYFDGFGVEDIAKEINKFIGNKNIIANIFRIQAYDSVMCGYFCIGLIKYMFMGKSLPDFINLFSPNDFKNDDIILNYF